MIRFDLDIQDEDSVSPESQFSDSADVALVEERRSRTPWGWCSVTLQCTLPSGAVGEASLGACSYEDEEDFIHNGMYEDLCHTAFKNAMQDRYQRAMRPTVDAAS